MLTYLSVIRLSFPYFVTSKTLSIKTSFSSGSSAQRARANLYGALLNYLRIGRKEESTSTDTGRLKKANIDVLSSFGDVFIDVICRDAVSGHDVRKMLALSLLVSVHLPFKSLTTKMKVHVHVNEKVNCFVF